MSYKFKSETGFDPIKFHFLSGRKNGAITPAANLEPVQLAGIVKRASLYMLTKSKTRYSIGRYCICWKGGEIIPKIIAVDLSKRSENSEPTKYITHCPECHTELIKMKEK
jgi:DNA ligase (NAD+)